jgi:hypothetical protein
MSEDRIAKRNRGNASGVWLLVALALVAGLLLVAAVLKNNARLIHGRLEAEAAAAAPVQESSTGTHARSLPLE